MLNEIIAKKAKEASTWFTIIPESLTGIGKDRMALKSGRPDWIFNMVRECNHGWMGDDRAYRTIYRILELIYVYKGNIEAVKEQIKPDNNIDELIDWSKSFIRRMDKALSENNFKKYISLLKFTQKTYKLKVLSTIIKILKQQCG